MDFEEDMMEVVEEEMQVVVMTLEKVLEILLMVAVPEGKKIIDEANAENNQKMCRLMFPPDHKDRDKDKERVNIMALILTCIHNAFDFFEDTDVVWKKRALILLKKYLIFMMELTENSGTARLEHCEE